MLKQNLAPVSTATLVRKISPVLSPYTASDLWEGVRDGVLVESEIIWWQLGELMHSLVEIKPNVHFVKPLVSSRKYVLIEIPPERNLLNICRDSINRHAVRHYRIVQARHTLFMSSCS
jgi:hypothetical protein